MTRIEEFGWKGEVEPGLGRIVSAHGDYYHLVCNEQPSGEILARKKKSVFSYRKRVERQTSAAFVSSTRADENADLSTPITGDFVRFRYNSQGESLITALIALRTQGPDGPPHLTNPRRQLRHALHHDVAE